MDLTKDLTTHLVAKEAVGEKYSHAKSWGNVHIVSLNWIEDCIKYRSKNGCGVALFVDAIWCFCLLS